MRLDDAFFVYFLFLWCYLPSIVSHITVCMIFFFSHFYLRGHGIFMWCVSLQTPLCFPPAMPPFDFPQLYALAAGGALGALMHRSLDVTIRQMLLSPLPITYGPPALKHSLFISAPSIVARLEGFQRENQQLCSMSAMAAWVFLAHFPHLLGNPGYGSTLAPET